MYCHHCVRSFAEDAIYCSQCGRKLLDHNVSNEQKVGIWPKESLEEVELDQEHSTKDHEVVHIHGEKEEQEKKGQASIRFFVQTFVGLFILAIIVSGLLFSYYKYELKLNEEVLNMQASAKLAAMNGDYMEAIQYLEQAIALRPNFKALAEDENIIHDAIRIERLTEELEETINKGVELEADAKLNFLQREISGYKEPLFDKHREKLEELNMKFTILSLTNELATLGTIKELGNLLNVANGLIGEEAHNLREQIIDRIRTTAAAEINELLNRKRYTAALNTIDSALVWVRGDDILLDLKQHVKMEQAAYELAEQQRIERAMEAAAAEDYINQTAAVELLQYDKMMNELGQIVLVASLKNVATRAIYDIELTYTITNELEEVISQGTSKVTPNYVAPNEGMTLSITLPMEVAYESELKLNIDEGAWSLE